MIPASWVVNFEMQQKTIHQKRIWIAWERQRRSLELSRCFQCKLFLIIKKGVLRYPYSIIKTLLIINQERPDVLFVQNPSMILAFFTTLVFRPFFNYKIVVDRHSNFLLTPKKRFFLFEAFFHFLSFTTIRFADLTIVTNPQLASVVNILGGKGKILPDKIPALSPSGSKHLIGRRNVLVISSFAKDEPVDEIIKTAAEFVSGDVYFYFTGNYERYHDVDSLKNVDNIVLTGYVPEQKFVDLLFAADVVMVLTQMEYTLLCGCYEAVAAEKILITSDTFTLRSLFQGAIFVQNKRKSIKNGVQYAFNNRKELICDIKELKRTMSESWKVYFEEIINDIFLC